MSVFHVNIIREHLETHLAGGIDISDLAGKSEEDRTNGFLTRALAAFAISTQLESSVQSLGESVTDEYHDNGIDALHFDPDSKVLFVVQTKWSNNGSGSISRGDTLKFIRGIEDLIQPSLERFGPRLQAKKAVIETALRDPLLKCVALIAYSGQGSLGTDIKDDLDHLVDKLNDAGEFMSYRVLKQSDLYNVIYSGARGEPIDLEVVVGDWGRIEEPYEAYYGHVSASDIVKWHGDHYPSIVAPNIRGFLGDTDVNVSIAQSIYDQPDRFWYFNNGITVLCASIRKKAIGGADRSTGIFDCHGASIVNGAQTLGALARAASKSPDKVEIARVLVRFISLERSPPEFQKLVTRRTNTQNRIEKRDFVSLDPNQERLKAELLVKGIEYIIRSGETGTGSGDSFDVVDATVARACIQSDVSISVQAKREIGKLWDNIETTPYTMLFNNSVNGVHLWRAVQMLRQMEGVFRRLQTEWTDRDQLYAYHANRFVEHLVFAEHKEMVSEEEMLLETSDIEAIKTSTLGAISKVKEVTERLYPGSYLASLFKNNSKTKALMAELSTN